MIVVAFALALVAQTKPAEPQQRRTEIVEIEPDVIEASPLGPKDVVVHAPPKTKLRSLIKVRTSFEHELLASVGSIRN